MKRLLIGGIILVIIGIGAGIFFYERTVTINNSLVNNKKDVSRDIKGLKNSSENISNNVDLSKENDSQNNRSSVSDSSKNSNNKTKVQSNTNNEVVKSDNINWNLINSEGVLSKEEVKYLSNGVGKALYADGATTGVEVKATRDMITYVNDIIIPLIRSKLSAKDLANFNETVENFESFNNNSTKSFVSGRRATISNDKGVYLIDIRAAYLNFAAYLISSYSNYKYNPTLTSSVEKIYEFNGQGIVPNNLMNNFLKAKSQVQVILNNMDSNNNKDVISSYNDIYNILNNSLNENYGYIKTNIDKIVGPTLLTNLEEQWINFKNRQIEIAGQGLTGINKEIAQKREAIRLTELRNYNLMYNMAYNLRF